MRVAPSGSHRRYSGLYVSQQIALLHRFCFSLPRFPQWPDLFRKTGTSYLQQRYMPRTLTGFPNHRTCLLFMAVLMGDTMQVFNCIRTDQAESVSLLFSDRSVSISMKSALCRMFILSFIHAEVKQVLPFFASQMRRILCKSPPVSSIRSYVNLAFNSHSFRVYESHFDRFNWNILINISPMLLHVKVRHAIMRNRQRVSAFFAAEHTPRFRFSNILLNISNWIHTPTFVANTRPHA